MADPIWGTIKPLRLDFADYLDTLSPAQWTTPSLCTGWNVQQLVGHLIASAYQTPMHFIGGLASNGFRFNAMTAKESAKYGAGTPAQVVQRLRDVAERTTAPPGPVVAMLGENVVHPEDVRRSVGSPIGTYPADALVTLLDFYSGSNLLTGAKKRIEGLTVRATDVDWTKGSGPEVAGPAPALLQAMTGRKAAVDDLKGDGVATLSVRF